MPGSITSNQWTHDQWLSTYAVNFAGAFPRKKRFGSFLCPIVPVTITDGKYDYHDPGDLLQVVNTSRPRGRESNKVHSTVIKKSYTCQSQGLSFDIDDDDLTRMRGSGEETQYKQAKVEELIVKGLLSYDARVLEMLSSVEATTSITNLTSGTAMNNIGSWGTTTVDPFDQLKALRLWFKARAVTHFNKMCFGAYAWEKMANNPLMRDHVRYNSFDELTPEMLLSALRMSDVMSPDDILIVDDSYNAALPGGGMDAKVISGNDVWLFYSKDTPDRYDTSFAKCFNTGGIDYVEKVQSIYVPHEHREVTDVCWMDDMVVASPLSGIRLTIV